VCGGLVEVPAHRSDARRSVAVVAAITGKAPGQAPHGRFCMTESAPPPRIGDPPSDAPRVVLASGSPTRRAMLARAGVPVDADPPGVDEAEVTASLAHEGAAPDEVAEALAEMKARRIAQRHAKALVIGADQMLACDGAWFAKPDDRASARAHLEALSGRTHRLIVCAVAVKDDARLWHQTDTVDLTMRPLSRPFIDAYLDAVGDAALDSVGAYQLEGLGAQLFSRVQGDYFTVLGLPLLPLLGFLREHKVVPT
jgi:septum formation protein